MGSFILDSSWDFLYRDHVQSLSTPKRKFPPVPIAGESLGSRSMDSAPKFG